MHDLVNPGHDPDNDAFLCLPELCRKNTR